MKVTILGSGSVYSGSNCAGIAIDDSTLIDIGPGTIKQLIKEGRDLAHIRYIIITHLHLDHILDFMVLICNLATDSNPDPQHIKIYGPSGTEEMLSQLAQILGYDDGLSEFIKNNCEFFTIHDGDEIEADGHIYKAHRVEHGEIEAYGYNIDGKLGFTGDATMCDVVNRMAAALPILICDCSRIDGSQNHMGIDNLNQIAISNPNLEIIPTHYRDDTREALRASNPHHFPIIDDGYTFEI